MQPAFRLNQCQEEVARQAVMLGRAAPKGGRTDDPPDTGNVCQQQTIPLAPPVRMGQAGQCPLTALARAEYPTPPDKGRRSALIVSISACRRLGDMAAITFVVGA
jgi:hypothetical protein